MVFMISLRIGGEEKHYGNEDRRNRGKGDPATLMPEFISIVRWQNEYDRFAPRSTAEKPSNHLRLVICHIFDYTARSDRHCLRFNRPPLDDIPAVGIPFFPSKERIYDVDYR
ncbi:hypothetical protein AB4Y96_06740 [Phyllobacterium sp. TAF24]|uniref:hypothetical protein n=1 Tax=Phyllobacterium sp. TAF24 TaxID=3233068 RepID=UPI003F94EECA